MALPSFGSKSIIGVAAHMFLFWTVGGLLVISGVRALSVPNLRSVAAIAPEGQAGEAAGNATDSGGRAATSESGSQNPSASERLPQIAFLIAGQVRAFSRRDVRRDLSEHLFKAFSGEKAYEKIKRAHTVQLFYLKANCDRRCSEAKEVRDQEAYEKWKKRHGRTDLHNETQYQTANTQYPQESMEANTSGGTSYTWSKMKPDRWIAQNTGRSLRSISAAEFPDEIGSWQGIRSWAQTGHVAGNISFEEMDPDLVRIVDYDVPNQNATDIDQIILHCFPKRIYRDGDTEGATRKDYTDLISKYWGMLREAYKLVESWEERNSMRFDIIVYVRPDLRFHRDLPFTYMDIDWHRDWILDQGSAPDWFWIMPRDVATDAFQTLSLVNETLTTSPCCARRWTKTDKPVSGCPGEISFYIPSYWHRVKGYNLTNKQLKDSVFNLE